MRDRQPAAVSCSERKLQSLAKPPSRKAAKKTKRLPFFAPLRLGETSALSQCLPIQTQTLESQCGTDSLRRLAAPNANYNLSQSRQVAKPPRRTRDFFSLRLCALARQTLFHNACPIQTQTLGSQCGTDSLRRLAAPNANYNLSQSRQVAKPPRRPRDFFSLRLCAFAPWRDKRSSTMPAHPNADS